MVAIADSFKATVNQFVGDGIMIFFAAPALPRPRATRTMRSGPCGWPCPCSGAWPACGRIGSRRASRPPSTYSAIGNQTNVTARIQDHYEPGKVLISHLTWALVQGEIPCKERGEIEVKGLHDPVRVYEVVEEASPGAGDG